MDCVLTHTKGKHTKSSAHVSCGSAFGSLQSGRQEVAHSGRYQQKPQTTTTTKPPLILSFPPFTHRFALSVCDDPDFFDLKLSPTPFLGGA
mmetsp:Transcript_23518/g.39659  ORF Transcript_23518/g.39659 Transcript_23518/m.39659 type:complete len:91 (+) Transcript_23518:1591-1863(+)